MQDNSTAAANLAKSIQHVGKTAAEHTDRALVRVVLEEWEHRFEDRGVPAGAELTADPSKTATDQDLVLAQPPSGRDRVCPLEELRPDDQLIGPVVQVVYGWEPDDAERAAYYRRVRVNSKHGES